MSEKIVCEYQGQYLDWDDDEHQEEDVIKCTLFTNEGIWDEYCYCDEEEAKECKLKSFVTLIEEKNIVEKSKEIERLNNKVAELEKENSVLKTLVANKDTYTYGIR